MCGLAMGDVVLQGRDFVMQRGGEEGLETGEGTRCRREVEGAGIKRMDSNFGLLASAEARMGGVGGGLVGGEGI